MFENFLLGCCKKIEYIKRLLIRFNLLTVIHWTFLIPCFIFVTRVSCSLDWPRTCCVPLTGLELLVFPYPFHRHAMLHLAHQTLHEHVFFVRTCSSIGMLIWKNSDSHRICFPFTENRLFFHSTYPDYSSLPLPLPSPPPSPPFQIYSLSVLQHKMKRLSCYP